MKQRQTLRVGIGYRITLFAGFTLACVAVAAGVMIQAHEDEALVPGIVLPVLASDRYDLFDLAALTQISAEGRVTPPMRVGSASDRSVGSTDFAVDRRVDACRVMTVAGEMGLETCRFLVIRRVVDGMRPTAHFVEVPYGKVCHAAEEPRAIRDLEVGADWLRYDGRQISENELAAIGQRVAESYAYEIAVVPLVDANFGRLVSVWEILRQSGVRTAYVQP